MFWNTEYIKTKMNSQIDNYKSTCKEIPKSILNQKYNFTRIITFRSNPSHKTQAGTPMYSNKNKINSDL